MPRDKIVERGSNFFLLKAKYHVVANDIGVDEGDIVLKGDVLNGV